MAAENVCDLPPVSRSSSSRSSSPCIPVEVVMDHLSCGLCSGPVASSLVLSCSHLFCGDCLFKHLTSKQQPSCPTCNMDLRAVPVRCLAMDKVAASIVPSLPLEEQQQYAKRKKDGQCAADKVNKMFWYLAPPAARPPAAAGAHLGLAGAAPAVPASMGLPLDPNTSCSLQAMANTGLTQAAAAAAGSFAPGMLPMGCMPGSTAAAGMPHLGTAAGSMAAAGATPLLQLAAAAQQMAQAQQLAQMQHQFAQVQLNPACRGILPDMGLQQSLMATERSFMGMGSQPLVAGVGYQELQQLSSMMGGMCQV